MIESKDIKRGFFVRLKDFFRSRAFRRSSIAIVVGGFLGFLYYTFLGSDSGSGEIMGNPYASVVWGIILALFLANSPCVRGRC